MSIVNAFYSLDGNNIEFPAGILQGVFFNAKLPRYMNFGAIGSVIGHEMTHGFDDRGKQKNYKGVLSFWSFLVAAAEAHFARVTDSNPARRWTFSILPRCKVS